MFIKKLKVAILTALTFTLLLTLYFSFEIIINDPANFDAGFIGQIPLVFICSLIGNVIYGIPVSIVVGYLAFAYKFLTTHKQVKWLKLAAYLLLSLPVYFFIPGFLVMALINSLFFFIYNELHKVDD